MADIVKLRKSKDQLYFSMTEGKKYPDYHEYDIKFQPTYKRIKDGPGYINKKSQAPRYTDRILFKNNTSSEVSLNSYTSLDDVLGSDHRPVQLDFDLNLRPMRYLQIAQLTDPIFAKQ